jgi:hypothetical protein
LAREAALGARSLSPVSDADRQIVRDELERLLAAALFRNSRRYPAFLRHVVEETLAGRGGALKERSLGVDLFDRPPDYDTNTDHIVRTTAAEIRKRIAQYYLEPGTGSQVRIELPPGSYVPEFRLAGAPAPPPEPVVIDSRQPRRWKIDRRLAVVAGAAALLAVLIALAVLRRLDPAQQASDRFWGPILNAPGNVTICIMPPVPSAVQPDPALVPNFLQLHTSEAEHLSVGDAEALAHLAAWLGAAHKPFQIRKPPVGLQDLRQGPVILIGGLNNEWTLRFTGELRYRFERDQATAPHAWIVDRLHPENRNWSFDYSKPSNAITVDYALISRVTEPTTGRQLITAAGIAKYGTAAAGEFLTNPNLLAELDRRAGAGWIRKNVQIVIRTSVIGDNSGSPEIVAVAAW